MHVAAMVGFKTRGPERHGIGIKPITRLGAKIAANLWSASLRLAIFMLRGLIALLLQGVAVFQAEVRQRETLGKTVQGSRA